MRRVLFVALLAALLVVPQAAFAGGGQSGGDTPGKRFDYVVGAGRHVGVTAGDPVFEVIFSAYSGPSGEHPGGHVFQRQLGNRGGYDDGKVTCLSVTGNRAIVGLTREDGRGQLISVVDNGKNDLITGFGPFLPTGPTVCPPPPGVGVPVIQGNYLVHDALP
jgi:hypothetical protein